MPPPLPALKLPLPPRRLGPGAILAIVVHVVVIVAVLWERSAYLRDTIGGPGPRGGGGDGGTTVRYVTLPQAAAPAATPPAAPPVVPTPEPLKLPEVKPLEIPRIAIVPQTVTLAGPVVGTGGQSAGSGGGSGGGVGPGTGSSTGPGTGGDGGYISRADPKSVLLPPDCATRERFVARFWIDEAGRVSRVEVDPPPKESDCRRELLAKLRGYSFRAAMAADGRPVASVYQVTFN